ncbi:hypothetical protein HPB48_009153 [Haemaphysalis longicornis]|uniref:Reverse transcriptase zinc-binding domain-containing protein n=1 Tax=Haemaphysalis longicornis TaxID=44386 RepID=A0A9J6GCZ2_HAELO|nr:hypothetical protein HPB48_009153 [Haemaphysalis longicornis]
MFDILEGNDEPAATLLRYWLGPLGKHIEDRNWNQVAKSETPGRHQTTVVTYLKQARQHLQDANLRELSPIEASEKLPTTAFGVIRPPATQLQWKIEASAMATRDRLAKWRITRDWWCTYCGQPETTDHVFAQCRVPKAFWRRLSWITNIHLTLNPENDQDRNAGACEKLRFLYTALGQLDLTNQESYQVSWCFSGVVWLRGTDLVVRGTRAGDQP